MPLIPSNKALIAAGTVLVLGAAYLFFAIGQTYASIESTRSAITELHGQLKTSLDRANTIKILRGDPKVPAIGRTGQTRLPARAAAAQAQGMPAFPANVRQRRFAEKMRESAFQAGYSQLYRDELRFEYGPLYHALALSPEQVDRFETSTVEALGQWVEAKPDGLTPNTSESDSSRLDGPLRVILGDEGYEAYLEYGEIAAARAVVARLTTKLLFTNSPLTAQKAEQIVAIFEASSPEFQAGGRLKLTEPVWAEALARAKSILSAPQISALAAIRERQKTLDQLGGLSF